MTRSLGSDGLPSVEPNGDQDYLYHDTNFSIRYESINSVIFEERNPFQWNLVSRNIHTNTILPMGLFYPLDTIQQQEQDQHNHYFTLTFVINYRSIGHDPTLIVDTNNDIDIFIDNQLMHGNYTIHLPKDDLNHRLSIFCVQLEVLTPKLEIILSGVNLLIGNSCNSWESNSSTQIDINSSSHTKRHDEGTDIYIPIVASVLGTLLVASIAFLFSYFIYRHRHRIFHSDSLRNIEINYPHSQNNKFSFDVEKRHVMKLQN